jgi:hypothetical protein
MLRVESSLNLHASERNIKVTSGRQRPLYGTAFLNSQLPSNLNRKNVTEIKVGLLVVCFKDYFLRLLCWCARTAPPYICVCLRPPPMLAYIMMVQFVRRIMGECVQMHVSSYLVLVPRGHTLSSPSPAYLIKLRAVNSIVMWWE